jgi:hypothetical protein
MLRSLLLAAAASLLLMGAADASALEKKNRATLRALDKITGRSTDIEVKVGEPVVFGSLKVELQVCFQSPPEEAPESAAFLKVFSTQPVAVNSMKSAVKAKDVSTASEKNPLLFSGWMYASSPGLSALEHPVYDIWVIRCQLPPPIKLKEAAVIPEAEEGLYDLPSAMQEVDPSSVPADQLPPRR